MLIFKASKLCEDLDIGQAHIALEAKCYWQMSKLEWLIDLKHRSKKTNNKINKVITKSSETSLLEYEAKILCRCGDSLYRLLPSHDVTRGSE